jgi:hypothetical protein
MLCNYSFYIAQITFHERVNNELERILKERVAVCYISFGGTLKKHKIISINLPLGQ